MQFTHAEKALQYALRAKTDDLEDDSAYEEMIRCEAETQENYYVSSSFFPSFLPSFLFFFLPLTLCLSFERKEEREKRENNADINSTSPISSSL